MCVLRGGSTGWAVLDCREAVRLNGSPVTGLRPLVPGDRLEFGRCALRVASDVALPPAPESSPPAAARPAVEESALEAQLRLARSSSRRNLGRYLLISELGSGAFSTVHRAWDEQQKRFVAVKVLVQLSPAVRARFAREGTVGGKLEHAHIVPVLDRGEHERRPYLVMELVEGRTLETVCEDEPLPPARAVTLLRDVASAIQHAHSQGILHRDLKPQNVIVGWGDHAWVVDFGLARFIREQGPRLTTTGALLGTPLYLAPEQAVGEGDERSDVYSLGALLFFALTGQSPLDASSLDRYLDALLRDRPEPPSSVRPGLDAGLDAIVLRCLEKEPELRYASAEALGADLTRWLSGAPFLVTRAPFELRARRWVRHHWLQLQLSAVAAVFVLASIIAALLIRG